MSKKPSARRNGSVDADLSPQIKKKRLYEHGSDLESDDESMQRTDSDRSLLALQKKEFTSYNIMEAIADVTRWRDLGLQFGLTSSRISEIAEHDEPKQTMVEQWLKQDYDANWEKLVTALTSPAMCENRVAKSIADRRGSSFDKQGILEFQSNYSSRPDVLVFNEANVRNAIESVKSIRELGERLKIPPSKLDEIDSTHQDNRKQKFVEEWFKVDVDRGWKRLLDAIETIKVHEWACSKSMSTGSVDTPFSPIVEELVHSKATSKRRNLDMIKSEYTDLKSCIAKDLTKAIEESEDDDLSNFQDYVEDLFDQCVPEPVSVKKIFKTLTSKQCLNYLDVYNMEVIVKKFGGRFKEKDKKMINDYKERLNGYKTAILITDFIEVNTEDKEEDEKIPSVKENQEKYDDKYRTKLSAKLPNSNIKIQLGSLLYIEQLWDSVCLEFNLPSLSHVLDSIVKGSIIINWIIQHTLTWKILEGVSNSIEFFKRECIAQLFLEDICIYDRETGVLHKKVIYVKLLISVQEGDDGKVEKIIQECFPVIDTLVDEEEKTALLFAAQNGHTSLVETLLQHEADMYLRDRNGDSILSLSKSHDSLHECLQEKCEGKMITASKDGNVTVVRKSLEIGVNPDAKEKDTYGWTSLMWACDSQHNDVVDTLLEHDADVDIQGSQDWTSLILSSRRGNLSVVKKLLDKGADIDKCTNTLWSALHWTAQEGRTEVAMLLLERGATATTRDKAGFSPLLQACQDGKFDIVKLIMKHNSKMDMNECTKNGWSGIMVSTKNGHEDIVRYLVDNGSDPHHQKEDGVTALHIASFKGHKDIVRYLCVTQRLEVNVKDTDGITPLMYAAKQGHSDSVRTLFENGRADPNLKENDNGWTALFFAVEAQQYEVLYYLLRSGRADVTQRDDNHTSLVDLAKSINSEHRALGLLSRYHKTKTEAMIREVKPVNLEIYTTMLEKFQRKLTADPRTPLSVGAG